MYKGSCLCGSVKYEVQGEIGPAYYCHCSRCRKASGSAFASNGVVASKDFIVVQGAESLKAFSREGVHRMFCSNCGSPVISRRDFGPDVVRVRLGTLDTPLDKGPAAHIFAASKAEWFAICDQLPQHAGWPPPL